jgi:hypothetical protein
VAVVATHLPGDPRLHGGGLPGVAVLARVCSVITRQDFDVLLVAGGVVLSAVPVVIGAVIGSTLPDVPLPMSGSLLGRKAAWLGRGLWAAVIFAIGATVGGLVRVNLTHAGVPGGVHRLPAPLRRNDPRGGPHRWGDAAARLAGLGTLPRRTACEVSRPHPRPRPRHRVGYPPLLRHWSETPTNPHPPKLAHPLPWQLACSLHLSHPATASAWPSPRSPFPC